MSLSKTRKIVAAGLTAVTFAGAFVGSSAPAQAGYYGWGGRHHGGYYGHRYHRGHNGGAIAAGLIGGLALGALAASASRPAYGYGYDARPVGYAYPAYGPGYYGGGCFIEKRKYVDEWGDLVIRRRKICQ
jgi:hypothetical protein